MSSLPVSELVGLQISKHANIGSLAILIFDYCITFEDEVRWTWFRPWDFTRVIFIISRYLPFVGCILTAYAALGGPSPPTAAEDIIHILGIAAAEGLLLLRVWAFWHRNRILLIGLLSYGVLTIIAVIVVVLNPRQLISGEEPSPGYVFEASRNGAVVFSFLAAYEFVILILTAYKRFHDYGSFQSSIIETVYRDGMIYVLCIIAITVTNVIVCAAFPIAYSNMFDILQLVIHSVLASRILFRLRSSNDHAHYRPSILFSESIHYLEPSKSTTMAGSEV